MGYFLPFYPRNSPENENLKKMKNCLEILSFYTSVPKNMITCYTVPKIWHVMDVIAFFHFGQFFALYPLYNPKNKNFTKIKKTVEISSFYTSVPKIMILFYTVPEIWCVTDVIAIFYFGIFFALYTPPPLPQTA